jgi:hypothetical protein
MTATWTRDELATIGATREVDIAPRRADGTLGPSTTVWVVRVGDDLYVRSYRGRGGTWYRAALGTHQGHLHAGGLDDDVAFDEDHGTDRTEIDAAYRAKYGRSSYVDAMVTSDAAATTLRLVPR